MNTSLYNKIYLINYSEADNTTISLKRNEHILNTDHVI